MGEAVYQETAERKLLHGAAVLLSVIASLAWLGLSLMLFVIGFESSEYERCAARWWHDMYSCVPIWLAFLGFPSAVAICLHYRRSRIALLVAVISLATLGIAPMLEFDPFYDERELSRICAMPGSANPQFFAGYAAGKRDSKTEGNIADNL
jgi:hypothetical protein